MTELRYLGIKDTNGKWGIAGVYDFEGIEQVLVDAIKTYGEENVTLAIDAKEIDALNRQHMIGQVRTLGQKVSSGIGTVAKRFEAIESRARTSRAHTPTARIFDRPAMRPPAPHRHSIGMMPNPSDYAKMKQEPQEQGQRHFTKWGRPLKPVNIFRDSRYTASYLSQQQRQAMATNRRYQRRRF